MNVWALPRIGSSLLWGTANGIRRCFFKNNIIKSKRFPFPVISVGNIEVGGTGKTPIVAMLADRAHEAGKRVCIVLRGYSSQWEVSGGVIEPFSPEVDPGLCGDEAALLHDLAPYAKIVVGSNRVRELTRASENIDVCFLDDGFQHLQIKRDLDIVLVTSNTMSDQVFREFSGALKEADLIFWTKGESRVYLPDTAIEVKWDAEESVKTQLSHKNVVLVCAVGQPQSVETFLKRFSARVVKRFVFEDHHAYRAKNAEEIWSEVEEGQSLVLTGKDWVKWKRIDPSADAKRQDGQLIVIEPKPFFSSEDKKKWEQPFLSVLQAKV